MRTFFLPKAATAIALLGLMIAGCAAPAEEGESGADALSTSPTVPASINGCDTASFSPNAQAVLGVLSKDHDSANGALWSATCDNVLPDGFLLQTPLLWGKTDLSVADACYDSSDSCDSDFGVRRCTSQADCSTGTCTPVEASVRSAGDAPVSMCTGRSDALLDEMYRVIVTAKRNVDITSLTAPDGRFGAMIRNALTRLNAAQPRPPAGDARAARLHVRFLHGREDSDKILELLTRDIKSDLRIRVSVGRYGVKSWNHAKMVAADGGEAVVGGHNLLDGSYFGWEPVHDLSMHVNGKAAMVAQQFANTLWNEADSILTKSRYVRSLPALSGSAAQPAGAFLDRYDPATARNTARGSARIIGVGTLGGFRGETNQASDAALYALIASAKKTLFLSQQDIVSIAVTSKISGYLLDAITSALANGADVTIVMSNNGNDYSAGWTPTKVAQSVRDAVKARAKKLPAGTDVDALLCERLHLAPLRFSALERWSSNNPLSNHAKVVMVDDAAFYIGSQNLYPGSLADPIIPGLGEFGFIVDDADAAAVVRETYLDPLWNASRRAAVSGSEAASCVLAP